MGQIKSLRIAIREVLRSLRARPTTALLAVTILTIGTLAATVTYSVVDAVVLKPLPFKQPSQLVAIEVLQGMGSFTTTAVPAYAFENLGKRVTSLQSLGATSAPAQTSIETPNGKDYVTGARVSPSLFQVLSAEPILGRVFQSTEPNVVMISFSLWRRGFGQAADVIGREMQLGTRRVTIVAVMPDGFSYPIVAGDRKPELWVPWAISPDELSGQSLRSYLQVVGRLQGGIDVNAASAEAANVFSSLTETGPTEMKSMRLQVRPLTEALVGSPARWLRLALAAVAAVLCVACANVANLLLARSIRRRHEFSVRTALGASRRRLVVEMVWESVLLSLMATGLSLAGASLSLGFVRDHLPPGLVRSAEIALNWRVFLVAFTSSVLTGGLFGAIPAIQATKLDVSSLLLRSGDRISQKPRWRSVFLVAQIALVAELLVAAAMFVGSFMRITTFDMGFDRRNVLIAERPGARGATLEVERRLAEVPGVVAVGSYAEGIAPLAQAGGFGGGASAIRIWPDSASSDTAVFLTSLKVGPDYFAAAGIQMQSGRAFREDELGRADRVVIDVATATRFFGTTAPLGRTMYTGVGTPSLVVGVVSTIFDRGPEAPANPVVYQPLPTDVSGQRWLIRVAGDDIELSRRVRDVLDQLPAIGSTAAVVRRQDDAFRAITAQRRFTAALMSIFGIVALAIGAVGIYGVMQTIVAEQWREFGLRLALGASRWSTITGILGQSLRHVTVGLIIGLGAGYLTSRAVGSMFFGLGPTTLAVYAVVTTLILGMTVFAVAGPAWRACSVDPLTVLRSD